jgi:GNAT superfamily N-acetyltransferase
MTNDSIEDAPGDERARRSSSYVIRPPRAGDLGWVVHRQGVLYAQELGFNEEFEGLVARIVGDFVRRYRPKKERCWIAEKDGRIVGSVFLVRQSDTVGRLRLLLVEPCARGLGIGSRLVARCLRFARRAKYRKVTLWTQRDLAAARRLYQKAGFKLTTTKVQDCFGRRGLVHETWNLTL